MSNPYRCLLTTKDFSILEGIREVLLERDVRHDEAFLRLLRKKLASATVVFQEDLAPQVATINSRVEFTIDHHITDKRILVHGRDTFPGLTLPITTLRGLALLGLTAGEMIAVERSDGATEAICLDRVSRQPKASLKQGPYPPAPAKASAAPEEHSSVVALRARRKPAGTTPIHSVEPDDDDPGPRSA